VKTQPDLAASVPALVQLDSERRGAVTVSGRATGTGSECQYLRVCGGRTCVNGEADRALRLGARLRPPSGLLALYRGPPSR